MSVPYVILTSTSAWTRECTLLAPLKAKVSTNSEISSDKPLSAFPGPKPLTEFKSVFKAAEVNSPVINRKAHRDICGGALGVSFWLFSG